MTQWYGVFPEAEFNEGDKHVVATDDGEVLVVKLDDEYQAISNLCTHEALPLDQGDIENGRIICPFHAAEFCLKTGAAEGVPAYEPVEKFETRIENGIVQVGIED